MIVRIITVNVTPGHAAEFEAATTKNRAGSIQEPGILRFDVLKDSATADRYYLYEVYRDEAATNAHKETQHYKEWKNAVGDLMAGERTSAAALPLAPTDPSEW